MGGRIYRATWGRFFAAIYERVFRAGEEAGLTEMRRDLVTQARGETLELGAGTGLNLSHYPPEVTRLVVTEPGEHMARRLREHTARSAVPLEVVEAPAERLPFPDDSFDTVVATLVLCTIPDPVAALSEVSRVLRPGGRLLFLEHVRSHDPGRARWQDRVAPAWRVFADGCHCNRDTLGTIKASALSVEDVEDDRLPKAPAIVERMIIGSAVAPVAPAA
jgi:SAM-dependent methyltransferase